MFMAPAVLDETGFDRFVSDNDTAVIGFVEEDGNAAIFSALASNVIGKRPGLAFAQVHNNSRELFDMFGVGVTATVIFRGRVVMCVEAGLPAADQLVRVLDGIAALNMERVRAEIAQEKLARESLAVHRVCPATRRGHKPSPSPVPRPHPRRCPASGIRDDVRTGPICPASR